MPNRIRSGPGKRGRYEFSQEFSIRGALVLKTVFPVGAFSLTRVTRVYIMKKCRPACGSGDRHLSTA